MQHKSPPPFLFHIDIYSLCRSCPIITADCSSIPVKHLLDKHIFPQQFPVLFLFLLFHTINMDPVSGTQDTAHYLVQIFGAESGYNRFPHLFCDLRQFPQHACSQYHPLFHSICRYSSACRLCAFQCSLRHNSFVDFHDCHILLCIFRGDFFSPGNCRRYHAYLFFFVFRKHSLFCLQQKTNTAIAATNAARILPFRFYSSTPDSSSVFSFVSSPIYSLTTSTSLLFQQLL